MDDAVIEKFCHWLRDKHAYNFLGYQKRPLAQSLKHILKRHQLKDVDALMSYIGNDAGIFQDILSELTVTTSSMFRNPKVFATLVRDVFPYLQTYSRIKVWHAGCSRGEEAYSLAILFKEHGLLDRTMIYATDINPAVLSIAAEGIYPARRLKEFSQNYFAAGGRANLADYFELKYGYGKFSQDLSSRILFSKHDLVSDTSFGEMQLILCRNVLIYFDIDLQKRVLELFAQSLCPGGFLCLGLSEAIPTQSFALKGFQIFSKRDLIYRQKGEPT